MFALFKKDTNSISINELDGIQLENNLIDIREKYEYKSGSIRGAKNIPMKELMDNPEKYLDKNRTYYIMCQSGARSARTTAYLAKAGYHVINVAGGMSGYRGNKGKS